MEPWPSSQQQRGPRGHARSSWSSVTRDSVVDNLLLSFDLMPDTDMADDVDHGYAHVLTSSRFGGRQQPLATSVEDDDSTASASTTRANSILDRGRPVPSLHSSYEAYCPEPTIRTGARRSPSRRPSYKPLSPVLSSQQSMASLIAPPRTPRSPRAADSPVLQTTFSNSTLAASSPRIPQSIRDQASEFVRYTTAKSANSSPRLAQDYFAPIVSPPEREPAPLETTTQRPGFFRRVFGSSSRSIPTQSQDSPKPLSRQPSFLPAEEVPTPKQQQQQQTQRAQPPQTGANHIISQIRTNDTLERSSTPTPPVISKKSSFFRRRKKSVSELSKTPTLPAIDRSNSLEPPLEDLSLFHPGYTDASEVAVPLYTIVKHDGTEMEEQKVLFDTALGISSIRGYQGDAVSPISNTLSHEEEDPLGITGARAYEDEIPSATILDVTPTMTMTTTLDIESHKANHADEEKAKRIFDGEDEEVTQAQTAAYLGGDGLANTRTLNAYAQLFDFTGQNVLTALRKLCSKLLLRAETQQIDRILTAMSHRWTECNPDNGFKGADVVYSLFFAIILLNTDQHMADVSSKMTRAQFVKNTTPMCESAAAKAATNQTRPPMPWQNSAPLMSSMSGMSSSPVIPAEPERRSSVDLKKHMNLNLRRLSTRPGMGPRYGSDPGPDNIAEPVALNALVNQRWVGSDRGWISELESILKAIYASVMATPLPLHDITKSPNVQRTPVVEELPVIRRTGSIISKAPSEGFSYRSRKPDAQNNFAQRWQSKNRSRQKVYSASTVPSSRTSFDDSHSMLSPAASSMWSKISKGQTQPTMSVESFGFHQGYKQSVGFANALSQAIIREEGANDAESAVRIGSLLEDDSLGLEGAPWAKEGFVQHKHHLDGPNKKAKERNWAECFAVVEKGHVHLFAFNRGPSTKITSSAMRSRKNTATSKPSSTVVGGGNWTENAEELAQFPLRHTLATLLPVPGYSKTRPHVFALSLPTGAVHLFQVGTQEIAEEFASTVNYWSARLSKEPLMGGVDNIEYGWSDNILGNLDETASKDVGAGTTTLPRRTSIQSSLRPSFDNSFTRRPSHLADAPRISDWKPPAASMLPSQLLECDQLRSLKAYITTVEAELEKHNELRSKAAGMYSGTGNLGKVMGNWERKSAFLLREVVKFRTYIEALERAGRRKGEVYEGREEREREKEERKV